MIALDPVDPKLKLALLAFVLTMLALGLGYIPPVTSRLPSEQMRLRHLLMAGALLVALASHFARATAHGR